MDWLIGLAAFGTIAFGIWRGLNRPSAADLITYANQADGTRAMVCKTCNIHLITTTRHTRSAFASILAVLVGVLGGISLLFYHLIGGAVLLLLAMLISHAGRGKHTVLRCPACGVEIET